MSKLRTPDTKVQYNMSDYAVYYGSLACACLVSVLKFDQGFVISMGLSLLGAGIGWVLLTVGLSVLGVPPKHFSPRAIYQRSMRKP